MTAPLAHGGLTARQRDAMRVICRHVDTEGIAPSFDEIGASLCIGKSSVHRLLKCLEERGFVRRIPGRARAIEVLRRIA